MRGHRFGRYGRGIDDKPDKSTKEMLGSALKLFSYLAPYWWLALLVLGLTLAVTGLELVRPRLIRILLDDAIPNEDNRLLHVIALVFVGVIAGAGLLQFTNSFLRHRLGQQIIRKLRIDLYRHLQELSLTFFESRETGDIMSRVVNDTESVEDLVVHSVENFLSSVLILDEATSSVDTETERMIQNALERAAIGRTTIIIAHRLSTTAFADQVAVLVEGRIKEIGTPQELLEKDDSLYAYLWNLQQADLKGNGGVI